MVPSRTTLALAGLVVACGKSPSAAVDAGEIDASTTDASDAGDGSVAPSLLAPAFFSMTTNTRGASHLPTVPFGGLRLWDTTAVWPLINTADGVYNFAELDAWLAEAHDANVDVIFTFGRTPTWASADPTQPCTYGMGCNEPPSDLASGDTILKNFTTALVNHSVQSTTAHIKYYEIWNEPDLSGTWMGTAAQLVTMAHDISTIVHANDPSALVIGPSPSTGNAFGIHFLPGYYTAGGAPYQDLVGMHGYLYTGAVFATVPEGIVDVITQLKLLMTANNVGDEPIFFTEGSWGNAPNNTTMTDDEKVAYLAREYLLMWMNGVSRYYWYAWDNSTFGTLSNGTIEPAGTAYGILESWLVGSSHAENNCTKASDATWSCALSLTGGAPALILWNPNATHTATVAAAYTHYVTLDDTAVHAISGSTVTVGAKPVMVTP